MTFLFQKKPLRGEVNQSNNAVVYYNDLKENKEEIIEAEVCLVSTGRAPYTRNLGLENINVKLDKNGRLKVNNNLMTDEQGVFAIGDVIPG